MSRPKQADRIAALENAVATLVTLIQTNQGIPVAAPAPTVSIPAPVVAQKVPSAKLSDETFGNILNGLTTKALYWTQKNGCHAAVVYNPANGFLRFCRPENAGNGVITVRLVAPGSVMDAGRIADKVPGLPVWQYRAKAAR